MAPKKRPPITESERQRIAERHSGIEQDPLPGMPEPDLRLAKKPRTVDRGKVAWRRLRPSKKNRLGICAECIQEIRIDGSSPARPAIWRRTESGKVAEMCSVHAEPLRSADEAAKPKKKRRTRKWR